MARPRDTLTYLDACHHGAPPAHQMGSVVLEAFQLLPMVRGCPSVVIAGDMDAPHICECCQVGHASPSPPNAPRSTLPTLLHAPQLQMLLLSNENVSIHNALWDFAQARPTIAGKSGADLVFYCQIENLMLACITSIIYI